MAAKLPLSRREFVKGTGGLLIGFSLADSAIVPQLLSAAVPPQAVSTTPSPARLDAWLRIEKDETIRVFTGKAEIGMGVETAYSQIVAEELDVAPARVLFVMGDTAETADQGGVGGSTSVAQGAKPLRNASATARFLLLQLAATRLGVPADQLEVKDGIVSVKGDPSKHISYGELAGGADLNDALNVSGAGFGLNVQGAGKPKDPASYTVVGTSLPRVDMPAKILGHFTYITDVRVPGMLHGRVIRPAGVGATPATVDEKSLQGIPGVVKVVVKGNFVGVVAENEWSAIRAAKALKIAWSAPVQAFPEREDLYRNMRAATPKATRVMANQGDAAAVLASATKKVESSYEWPFQSHASMGPGCAVADFQPAGITTIWSGAQKPHALQQGIAQLLNLPADKVHVIWVEDSGSYGRGGYEDTAGDAALLSQAVGRPVRVQWMRADMTAWGAKGPASVFDLSAAVDAAGSVTALQYTSRAFSGTEILPQPNSAGNLLAGQLSGVPNTTGADEFDMWGDMAPRYEFPNLHAVGYVVPTFYATGSPLRGTHLRDPGGPATTFAVESFMDELAASVGADPIEFRLKYIGNDARAKAVLASVAEHAKWDRRPSPKKLNALNGGGIGTGQGGDIVGTLVSGQVGSTADGIFRPGTGGVGYPSCLFCPAPQYSEEARKVKYEGIVVLQVIIQPDGHATNIEIVKGPGLGLEAKAIDAVRTWRFKAALGPSGAPVATVTPVEVAFRLPKATALDEVATGRGVALAIRNGTYVATVAEVEVARRTGAVHVRRLVCVHDCGLIVNPEGLRAVISANLLQSLGRALKEEVTFNRSTVTSVDWVTYPVTRASDVPEQIDIVLLNHPDLPPGGAGEPSSRPTAAAIANAVFDATGVRVRQAPLSPARVKAAWGTAASA
jgi:nicotinate dehydrogenase subunit B